MYLECLILYRMLLRLSSWSNYAPLLVLPKKLRCVVVVVPLQLNHDRIEFFHRSTKRIKWEHSQKVYNPLTDEDMQEKDQKVTSRRMWLVIKNHHGNMPYYTRLYNQVYSDIQKTKTSRRNFVGGNYLSGGVLSCERLRRHDQSRN